MANPYGLHGAPAVGNGIPGLPKRKSEAAVVAAPPAPVSNISMSGMVTYQSVSANSSSSVYNAVTALFVNKGNGILVVANDSSNTFGYIYYVPLSTPYRFDLCSTYWTSITYGAGAWCLYPDGSGYAYGSSGGTTLTGYKFKDPLNPLAGTNPAGTLTVAAALTMNQVGYMTPDMTRLHIGGNAYDMTIPGDLSTAVRNTGVNGGPSYLKGQILPDGMGYFKEYGYGTAGTYIDVVPFTVKNNFNTASAGPFKQFLFPVPNTTFNAQYDTATNTIYMPFFAGSGVKAAGVSSICLG